MLIWLRFASAIAFYTCLPLSASWTLDFRGVARLAPLVGVIIGFLLGMFDWVLQGVGLPPLTRSAVVVIAWIGITGGLHLDGAMDTADGLAVTDPQRRLEVMADSRSGAFGVMVAIAIVLLKTVALADLDQWRWLIFMVAAGWGRWGQQVAIALYLYLKPTGKGAFHKEAISSLWDALPSLALLLGLSFSPLLLSSLSLPFFPSPALPSSSWILSLLMALGGSTIAFLIPAWFNYKLGGHTGDTYGAVVEWTEALLLVVLTAI